MKGSGSRRSTAPERGATVVEFAVVAPLLFLLLFGVIEIGRLIATYTSVSAAAREGARYAVAVSESPFTPGVPRYADCAGIKEAAKAKSVLVDLDDSDIFIGWDTGPDAPSMFHTCDAGNPATDTVTSGHRVIVRVSTEFSSPIPLISNILGTLNVESEQKRTVLKGVVGG